MIKFLPTRVIDGDTYEGDLLFEEVFPDFDFLLKGELKNQRVRLHVVDTPETRGAYLEETEVLGGLVGDLVEILFSSAKEVHFDVTEGKDSFGRWVGEVWITDAGGSFPLSEFLLDNGLATVWEFRDTDFFLNKTVVNQKIEDCLNLIEFAAQ